MQKVLGWTVEIVERPRRPAPEGVLKAWAEEWAKEGKKIDWQKLLPPRGFQALPRRWVVERSFAWICHSRRMSKDYERLLAKRGRGIRHLPYSPTPKLRVSLSRR